MRRWPLIFQQKLELASRFPGSQSFFFNLKLATLGLCIICPLRSQCSKMFASDKSWDMHLHQLHWVMSVVKTCTTRWFVFGCKVVCSCIANVTDVARSPNSDDYVILWHWWTPFVKHLCFKGKAEWASCQRWHFGRLPVTAAFHTGRIVVLGRSFHVSPRLAK